MQLSESTIKNLPKSWAMLADNWENIELPLLDLTWPMIIQPKLNGVRAKWEESRLVSRQLKVFPEVALPSVYKELREWSAFYPNLTLDGELYLHGMPFQEIAGMVAMNRGSPHPSEPELHLHAFDLVDYTAKCEERLLTLSQIYKHWVPVGKCPNPMQISAWLAAFLKAGYEGAILRNPTSLYVSRRTKDLLKLLPWKSMSGVIRGWTPGTGKYKGMAGALVVKFSNGQYCKVSGGLSDLQRKEIVENFYNYQDHVVLVNYRDLSTRGIPLKPQIAEFLQKA